MPVGFWRSVGHSHNAFFDESFIDELAAGRKKDPFEFRRELLADKPRHLKVLETGGREGGLGPAAAGGHGRGIAVRASFGSIVAQVAEVAVDADGRTLQVKRSTCAIDCGPVVNPRSCARRWRAASSTACRPRSTARSRFADGGVEQSNFHDYDAAHRRCRR